MLHIYYFPVKHDVIPEMHTKLLCVANCCVLAKVGRKHHGAK